MSEMEMKRTALRPSRGGVCAVRALALCAALLAGGCGRDEEAAPEPEPPAPYLPESYMNDPAFRAGLDTRRKARESVVARRTATIERMKAVELAAGGDAAVLATNAEWKALSAELEDLNARHAEAQREMLRYVRERIVPPKSPAAAGGDRTKKDIEK